MKREELKTLDLLCDMGVDVNGNRNLQPYKAYDIDEVNLVIKELEAENERLKAELKKWEDRSKVVKDGYDGEVYEWEDNYYIVTPYLNVFVKGLLKENAKLKSLALHGMFGYACAKMNVLVEKQDYRFGSGKIYKDFSRWRRLSRLWREAYRKAKKKLKEEK